MKFIAPKDFLTFLLASGILFFSYSISSIFDRLNLFNIILQKGSLNTWYFYGFNNTFFPDFNFHGLHPYYLAISCLLHFISTRAVTILFILLLLFLFLYTVRNKLMSFSLYILWLLSIPLLFYAGADLALLWFQLLLLILYNQKIKSAAMPMGFKKNLLIYKSLFYFFLSLIFLPGIIMLFLFEIINSYYDTGNIKVLSVIFLPFFITLISLTFFHIILAHTFFEISALHLMEYIMLPLNIYITKFHVTNVQFTKTALDNLMFHRGFYIAWIYILALSLTNKDYKFILLRFAASLILIVSGFFISWGESIFFPASALFLAASNIEIKKDFERIIPNKKILIMIFTVFVIMINMLMTSQRLHAKYIIQNSQEPQQEQRKMNIVVSYNDLPKLAFDNETINKFILVDLKIIPANVLRLVTDIKNGKIDPFINKDTMEYLEKELEYGQKVEAIFSESNYTFLLNSSIHPQTEKQPYRRVFYLWNKVKDKSGIVLF